MYVNVISGTDCVLTGQKKNPRKFILVFMPCLFSDFTIHIIVIAVVVLSVVVVFTAC